jgi:hypothetical protein
MTVKIIPIQVWTTLATSDSELFPEDVSDTEDMGSIPESETSDYTSEDDSFPPPRKLLKKENQNQEVKLTTKKNKTCSEKSAIGSRAGGDSNSRAGKAETLYYMVKGNWGEKNLKTSEHSATGRVQKTPEHSATGRVQKTPEHSATGRVQKTPEHSATGRVQKPG